MAPRLRPSFSLSFSVPSVCFFAGCFSIGIRARSFNFIAVIPILVGFDYAQTHTYSSVCVCVLWELISLCAFC